MVGIRASATVGMWVYTIAPAAPVGPIQTSCLNVGASRLGAALAVGVCVASERVMKGGANSDKAHLQTLWPPDRTDGGGVVALSDHSSSGACRLVSMACGTQAC